MSDFVRLYFVSCVDSIECFVQWVSTHSFQTHPLHHVVHSKQYYPLSQLNTKHSTLNTVDQRETPYISYMIKKIAVLTGAGISAESGIKTFRDNDGLWEEFDVMTVASYDGWMKDKELVLKFYNDRRKQLTDVEPNQGHLDLLLFEQKHDVVIITQNVDDLHERAGSSRIIHLHGELNKVRCTVNKELVYDWTGKELKLGDLSDDGHQLRPHIVWFGEMVPLLDAAAMEVATADYIIIVGTSMQVYPAAGLVGYAKPNAHIYYIDPKPQLNYELRNAAHVTVIEEKASVGVKKCFLSLTE